MIIIVAFVATGVVSAAANVTDDAVSIVDETDSVKINFEDTTVDLDNEKSFSLGNNQNISSNSTNGVDSIEDSSILGVSYTNRLTDGSNYATDVIGGVSGEIISDGDNFIFRPVDRQDVIIKKDINNKFRNYEFQIYKMLPTSFKYGDYIYVLREPSSEISNEWYYDKIYMPSNTEMYFLHLDAPYDANGAIGGFAGDKMGVYAKVTDSKGNLADGYVVFDDLATKSNPIMLTNGRAYYEYTLKNTGSNGGFIYAYYYKGSYSEANLKAENSIKYIGLSTTYVFEFDQEVYYYFDDNKWVTINISVYNQDKPTKEVSGKIQGTFTREIWVGDGIKPRDIVWDPINQKGTASFTLFVEGRTFVGFRLMPGNTIRCDDYYCPVKYLNTPVIDASINRVGSQINVNMTFEDRRHQAIGFGEATLSIPSVNKTFRFNVTNKSIQFSFTQEDYFSNGNTIFYINYHDNLGYFADGQKEIIFKDTIYTGTSMSITNLRFEQGSNLTPKVTITTAEPFEKQGFVKLIIDGKTYVEQVNNGICQFNIYDYYGVGSYNAIFEYYYDNSHLVSIKNVTIAISVITTDKLDFVIASEWVWGDVLRPKIQVVNKGTIVSKGFVAHEVTTSTIEYYLNGKPVYKKVLEECNLLNGYAIFDLGIKEGPYTENFYFYYDSSSNKILNKPLRFTLVKRPVELESVSHIDVAVGENITFDVSIKDYDKLLDLIPLMKRSDSYYKPWVDAKTHQVDIKMIKADYDNGVYTFVYSPTRNAETISFYIHSLYIQSELVIPVNLKKLDPVMELENNGTITLLNNKLGIKFANNLTTEGNFIITAEGSSKFKWVSRDKNYTYYEIPFNALGEKTINIVYKPTIYAPHNGFEKNITINIVKETPVFSVNSYEGKFGQSIPITINVSSVLDNYPTGEVTLTLNNKVYKTNINQNVIKTNLILPNKPGKYPVKIQYGGDDLFDSISSTFNVIVNKQNINLVAENSITVKSGEEIVLSIKGISEFNSNANLDYVNVDLGSNTVKCAIVNNAIRFSLPKTINFNNINIKFPGNDYFNSASKNVKLIKVMEDLVIPTIIDNANNDLSFSLPYDATGSVTLTINSKNYVSTVVNGKISFNLSKISAGSYDYVVSYPGDNNYANFVKEGNVVIKAKVNDVVIPQSVNPAFNKTIQISLPKDATGTVTLSINNQKYDFVINNGIVNVVIPDLNDGNYPYTITYSGDDKYSSFAKSNTFKVDNILPTNISAPIVSTVYNGNKYLTITLKDSQGNAVNGASISVNLNGIKTAITNENGQTKLTTNGLAPNTYVASITFGGNDNYNKSSTTTKIIVKKATPKLTAKAKTFKKSVKIKKYTVTLKTNQNKVMKNTKLTLKVNGKTYSAKTNAKGQATFKITKLTKKGKFIATIKYAGSKYYNAKTVKPKITVK